MVLFQKCHPETTTIMVEDSGSIPDIYLLMAEDLEIIPYAPCKCSLFGFWPHADPRGRLWTQMSSSGLARGALGIGHLSVTHRSLGFLRLAWGKKLTKMLCWRISVPGPAFWSEAGVAGRQK